MKIKHWQGYGVLNAKALKKGLVYSSMVKNNYIVIEVKGNHECGLETYDHDFVFNWLLKKFDKNVESSSQIKNIELESNWDNQTKEEVCIYKIFYEG